MTTEYESKAKAPAAKGQTKEAVSETKQTNVSIMCQTQAVPGSLRVREQEAYASAPSDGTRLGR